MKKKIYLPKSAEELKKLNHQKQAELWARYHNSPYERQFRALWYYIACENANLKIERKHLTKLEKYSENPDECIETAARCPCSLPVVRAGSTMRKSIARISCPASPPPVRLRPCSERWQRPIFRKKWAWHLNVSASFPSCPALPRRTRPHAPNLRPEASRMWMW